MAKRYSSVYKRKKNKFRYDYEYAIVEWLDENDEVIDSVGLSRENWKNREARNEYLDGWIAEMYDSLDYLLY